MKLQHVKLSKKQLDSVPEAERNLLILLAHAENELNALIKLFRFCSRHAAVTDVEKEACNAQAMAMGRLLTGKLYECWELLRKAFFGTQLSRSYEPDLDRDSRTALDSLKKYFGAKNLVEAVRNRHAFHYAPDQVALGYEKLKGEETLNLYLSEANANTLYGFADVIASYSLVEDIAPGNAAQAYEALISETSNVLGWFNQVIAGCMVTVIEKYLGGDLEALGATEIEVIGAPDWKDVTIPYFVEVADLEAM